jgi:hypothetical protein
LKWDYNNRTCAISMPGYVSNVLSKFQHDSPKHPHHTPSRYGTPVYGAKTQYVTKDENRRIRHSSVSQSKRSQDPFCTTPERCPTVLMQLNDTPTEQTKVTEKRQAITNQMLDYLATHPDATIRYHACDMILLHIHSDASYLSVSNGRSRLGGLFSLGNKSPEQETLHGSILNVAAVIKNVVAPAAESEVVACFHNAQTGALLRVTLAELGHTQPRTPLRTDSSTAFVILNKTIKQRQSKAMDIQYHWLTDRVHQKQFGVYWGPGFENLGDYHTKHHSEQHHKDMRHLILHE